MDVFKTQDGDFHQGALFFEGAPMIRMVVEKLNLNRGGVTEWEWMVWPVPGPWQEPGLAWHGSVRSLEAAKQRAVQSAIGLFASVTGDGPERVWALPVGARQDFPGLDAAVSASN